MQILLGEGELYLQVRSMLGSTLKKILGKMQLTYLGEVFLLLRRRRGSKEGQEFKGIC